jgi:hypothetical protein
MSPIEEILYELDYIINCYQHDPSGGEDPDELIFNIQECAKRIQATILKEIVPGDSIKKPIRETIKGRIQKKVAKKKKIWPKVVKKKAKKKVPWKFKEENDASEEKDE